MKKVEKRKEKTTEEKNKDKKMEKKMKKMKKVKEGGEEWEKVRRKGGEREVEEIRGEKDEKGGEE